MFAFFVPSVFGAMRLLLFLVWLPGPVCFQLQILLNEICARITGEVKVFGIPRGKSLPKGLLRMARTHLPTGTRTL
jgi:hypothetical protein